MTESTEPDLRTVFLIPYLVGSTRPTVPAALELGQHITDRSPAVGHLLEPMLPSELVIERDRHRGESAFTGVKSSTHFDHQGRWACTRIVGMCGLQALCVRPLGRTDITGVAATEASILSEFDEILAALDDSSGDPRPLWVHRILVADRDLSEIVGLAYGVEAELAGGTAVIADGLTGLRSTREDEHIEAVIDGLFLATQVWFVLEELWKRSSALADLPMRNGHLDETRHAIESLRIDARSLANFTRLQRFGVIDARRRIYDTALRSWRIDEELPILAERLGSFLVQLSMELDALRTRSDHRRNLLLFGLAFATLTQTGIGIYELVTGERVDLGPTPRLVIALLLGVPFVVALAVTMSLSVVGWLRDRKHTARRPGDDPALGRR